MQFMRDARVVGHTFSAAVIIYLNTDNIDYICGMKCRRINDKSSAVMHGFKIRRQMQLDAGVKNGISIRYP